MFQVFFRGFGHFCLDGRMFARHIGRNLLTNTRSAKASPLGRALQTAVIAYGPILAKVGNICNIKSRNNYKIQKGEQFMYLFLLSFMVV